MKVANILEAVQQLRSFGFEDVSYCPKTKGFSFQNKSDIMNNYVTVIYKKAFQKFYVYIYPIETANTAELQEIQKRLDRCIELTKTLNQVLEKKTSFSMASL